MGQNKKRISLYSLVIANILIWSFYFSIHQNDFHIKIYDVGQGDSIFLRTAGGYTILIDGGPNAKVVQYLGEDIPFYSRKIDLLILTHPQSDHLTGLMEVIKRYDIGSLWVSDSDNNSKQFEKWKSQLTDQQIEPQIVSQGDKMVFSDGTQVLVLWPKPNATSSDLNDLSVVTLISYGSFDALLTGDAEENNQPYSQNIPDIEVLKVPHHGSKTAVSKNFVAAVSPEVGVISVGSKNPYGHPREETIKILQDFGSKVYTTAQNGTVEIVSDGKSWYTTTQR